ncbi:MAG: hypothetical protein WCE62_04110 [Polyangiales bacterium]
MAAAALQLPIGDAPRGQLLSLLGLLVTAAIALSSTTLLGNAMAGIMLPRPEERMFDKAELAEFEAELVQRRTKKQELNGEGR